MSEGRSPPTPPHPVAPARCPHCDADYRPSADGRCWLCRRPIAPSSSAVTAAPPRPVPDLRRAAAGKDNEVWTAFGVLALLVGVGTAVVAPGMLLVVAVVALPAAIRTAVLAFRGNAGAAGPGPAGVLAGFLSSIGVTLAVGVASAVAFYATCFAVCGGMLVLGAGKLEESIFFVSAGVAAVVALALAGLLFYQTFPRKG